MGLFPIDCAKCKTPFLWFSGSLDQRCPKCIADAGLLPEPPPSPRYKVVQILPEKPKEQVFEQFNVFHRALATKMKEQYGLDHLTVEEVQEKWEEHSEDWCAGWLIETKEGIEQVFGVILEKL